MTPELLEEIKQLTEVRLRVGDVLASHCLLLHMELRAAQEENERLREKAKHTFTLDQITETMQTAIGVCTGYSPPMPQRQRTRCKPPPICPSCRCNAVYISPVSFDSLPEQRPMECLKCRHKWTAFFEQDEG